ncbi:signal peptidase I [Methanocalculus chunghsingensis]|uniref:signal peptidase I n=1 Tax=Methanocalculus chunghsingensis TaxID=156457 RepID=UPI001B8C920A|nr:signal peptidase I [Methanocalculus chunghsingensis]
MRKSEYAAFIATAAVIALLFCTPLNMAGVIGTSMEPTITQNDLVVIAPLAAGEPAVGDIIAFRPQEGVSVPIAHRIVSIEDDGTIRTRGDNLAATDPYHIRPDQIAGRVVLIIPYAGAAMHIVTSLAGYLALVLIPGLLLIALEIQRMRR